jgi:hypothetical protein
MDRMRVAILVLVLLVGFEQQAHAYTDPGTGALIFQVLGAAFVGGLFYVRRIRDVIMGAFRKQPKQQDQ